MSVELDTSGQVVVPPAEQIGGDKYSAGNITDSIAAIGRGASVIIKNALSRADEAREQEKYEQERLARAVASSVERLQQQLGSPLPSDRNPYKHLLNFEVGDASRFFGRDAVRQQLLADLMCTDSRCRFAVLHGEPGIGKSSLLKAGIVPALIADQQFPLLVQVTTQPLALNIKQTLLPNLGLTPNLLAATLQAFLSQAGSVLDTGKQVYVLLDQFERFFDQPEAARQEFANELANCLFDGASNIRWLLCIRSSQLGYLNTFQPTIPQPFVNTIVLPPLSRAEARAAMEGPAATVELEIEETLLTTLLDDLGGDAIHPSRLQLVISTLVEALLPGEKRLTMAGYTEAGQADDILNGYLDMVLNRYLTPEERERAWPILEAIVDLGDERATIDRVASRLGPYGLTPPQTRRILDLLETNRLLRRDGESYQLTSKSFNPIIRQWSAQQAALKQARLEATRQLERVRGSALRGFLGGALGFSLAFLIAFSSQIEETRLLVYITIQRAVPGGLAGLLLTLLVDVALVSYRARRRTMRWIVGALAGAASFALAVWFHALLRSSVGDFTALVLAALEGGIWGAVCGLGVVWVMTAERWLWRGMSFVTVASGGMLWLSDKVGHAFGSPDPASLVLLAGAVMPLCILGAAMLGRTERSIEAYEPDQRG